MTHRLAVSLPVVLAGLLHGCTCGSRSHLSTTDAPTGDAEPSASTAAAPRLPSAETPAVFSAPLAAARLAHGNAVAGLVAADGAVRVLRVAEEGSVEWSADAFRDAVWGADADLRVFPAADGAAVVWRGPRDGSMGRSLLVLGADGAPKDQAPIEVGPSFCGTADGLAWIEPHAGAATRVRSRRWSEATVGDVAGLAPDRDVSLVCGEHAVLILGDGEDDLTLTSFVPGDVSAQPPVVAIRESDFGDDDEREHDAYSFGDDLGLVWIGGSGTLLLREVPRGGTPTRWHRLKHAIGDEDDVVAVDGDAAFTYVVYIHETDEACPDLVSSPTSVRAIVADRAAGTDARFELAPPTCDRSAGPFWIAPAPGGAAIAWVERVAEVDTHAPPITGVALRTIRDGAVQASRIDLAADAVVDAGCDSRACFLAALERVPDGDGMQPGPVRLIPYP